MLEGFEYSDAAFIHDSPVDSIFCAPFNIIQAINIDSIQQQKLCKQASLTITYNLFSSYQIFYGFLSRNIFPITRQI